MVFTNHTDTVVATDLEDVPAVVANHYGSTMEQEGWMLDEWEVVPDDERIMIRNISGCGWDDRRPLSWSHRCILGIVEWSRVPLLDGVVMGVIEIKEKSTMTTQQAVMGCDFNECRATIRLEMSAADDPPPIDLGVPGPSMDRLLEQLDKEAEMFRDAFEVLVARLGWTRSHGLHFCPKHGGS